MVSVQGITAERRWDARRKASLFHHNGTGMMRADFSRSLPQRPQGLAGYECRSRSVGARAMTVRVRRLFGRQAGLGAQARGACSPHCATDDGRRTTDDGRRTPRIRSPVPGRRSQVPGRRSQVPGRRSGSPVPGPRSPVPGRRSPVVRPRPSVLRPLSLRSLQNWTKILSTRDESSSAARRPRAVFPLSASWTPRTHLPG
jgi:hypothetical protein